MGPTGILVPDEVMTVPLLVGVTKGGVVLVAFPAGVGVHSLAGRVVDEGLAPSR